MQSLLSLTTQHVVWDWNGTLFDDAQLCVDVMNELLAARALPAITMEKYQEAFRFPVTDYYRLLGFDSAREDLNVVSTQFIGLYQARESRYGLRQGAREALRAIEARGIPQSVLSASEHWRLSEQVERCGIRHHFATIAGIDNHFAGGKIDLGVKRMAQLGLPPDSVLLIGDTDHDAAVAEYLGIRCVLVHSGHQSPARLAACGVPVAQSLREITEALVALAVA